MGVYSVASLKRCDCSRWHSSDIGNPPSWHGSQSRRVPAVLFVWVYGEPGHQVCNQIYYSLSLFIYCFCSGLQFCAICVIKSQRIIQFSSFGPSGDARCVLFQQRLFPAINDSPVKHYMLFLPQTPQQTAAYLIILPLMSNANKADIDKTH